MVFMIKIKAQLGRIKRKIIKLGRFPRNTKTYFEVKKVFKKSPNMAVFITSYAMGDLVYGLTYLNAWRKAHPEAYVVLIADPDKEDIIQSFDGYDQVICFRRQERMGYRILVRLNGSRFYSLLGQRDWIFNTIPEQIYGSKTGKTCLELLKEYFCLSDDAEMSYPAPQKIPITSIPNFEENKNHISVINVYSSSNRLSEAVENVMNGVVCILRRKGYIVYSNVIGDQKPLEHTQPLRCSVLELYNIADEIPVIVSVRSGVMDWVVSTASKKFVLYPSDISDGFIDMFRMEQWKCPNIREAYLSRMDEKTVLQIFEEWLGKD